jgi:hypothetical protein
LSIIPLSSLIAAAKLRVLIAARTEDRSGASADCSVSTARAGGDAIVSTAAIRIHFALVMTDSVLFGVMLR